MDAPSGKCQQAIVRALSVMNWVPWRSLCRNHSLYKNKASDATILNRVKRAMIFEGMLEEELGEENSEGKREKAGRVVGDQRHRRGQPTDKMPLPTRKTHVSMVIRKRRRRFI